MSDKKSYLGNKTFFSETMHEAKGGSGERPFLIRFRIAA